MKIVKHKILAALLIITPILILFSSCSKEEDTIGIVKVVFSNGNPMPGATVVLDQTNGAPGTDPIDNLTKTATTDANGRAQFTYRYEAILDVTVSKTAGNNTYSGSSVLRLLRGETTTIVVEAIQ
tara:strand:- start:56 stop:430 length:375 start_codon:yes stop_codon:yes gene_type:complete